MKSDDLKIVFHEPWRKGQPHRVELRLDCRLVGEGGGITQAEALGVLQQYLTGSGAPEAWLRVVERALAACSLVQGSHQPTGSNMEA